MTLHPPRRRSSGTAPGLDPVLVVARFVRAATVHLSPASRRAAMMLCQATLRAYERAGCAPARGPELLAALDAALDESDDAAAGLRREVSPDGRILDATTRHTVGTAALTKAVFDPRLGVTEGEHGAVYWAARILVDALDGLAAVELEERLAHRGYF